MSKQPPSDRWALWGFIGGSKRKPRSLQAPQRKNAKPSAHSSRPLGEPPQSSR